MLTPENIEGFDQQGKEPNLPKHQPFAVPEGYFDQFASSVMARIHGAGSEARRELQELSPLLAGLDRSVPYAVPAGYFEQLPAVALLVNQPDPLPAFGAGVAMPYQVPAGYFEQIELPMVKRPAKVISMARRWQRMAVAAMLAAVIGTAGLVMFTGKSGKQVDPTNVAGVSTQSLDAFINAADAVHSNGATASNPANKAEIKSSLKDVSDKELDQFLEDLPVYDESSYN